MVEIKHLIQGVPKSKMQCMWHLGAIQKSLYYAIRCGPGPETSAILEQLVDDLKTQIDWLDSHPHG
jgi:hypothetical protein